MAYARDVLEVVAARFSLHTRSAHQVMERPDSYGTSAG